MYIKVKTRCCGFIDRIIIDATVPRIGFPRSNLDSVYAIVPQCSCGIEPTAYEMQQDPVAHCVVNRLNDINDDLLNIYQIIGNNYIKEVYLNRPHCVKDAARPGCTLRRESPERYWF